MCEYKAYELFSFFNLRKSQVTIFLGNVDKQNQFETNCS